MSDNVAMSLDEYIKKKKISRGGKLKLSVGRRGKGQVSSTRGKSRGRISTGGGSRGGRGRLSNKGRGRGGRAANVGRGGSSNRGNVRGLQNRRGRGAFQGRRGNFRVSPKAQIQFPGVARNPRTPLRGRFQSRRQNPMTRFINAGAAFQTLSRKRNLRNPRFGVLTPAQRGAGFRPQGLQGWPGSQSFARKRVRVARNILANRGANGGIAVSRFGLVTPGMYNSIQTQRQKIQQKINRAQSARLSRRGVMRSDFEVEQVPRYFNKAQLQQVPRNPRSRSRSRSRNRAELSRVPRNEEWTSTGRTVRNTHLDIAHPGTTGSSLNPEIQRRISILQQQGRRNRGEDDGMDSPISSDFRGPVVTSSIPLSDRFRRFMN